MEKKEFLLLHEAGCETITVNGAVYGLATCTKENEYYSARIILADNGYVLVDDWGFKSGQHSSVADCRE